jgi:hypothetical protein
MTVENENPTCGFLAPECPAAPGLRVRVMLEGPLEDVVKVLRSAVRRRSTGGKRGRKLNPELASTIRQRLASGERMDVLARAFGVSVTAIEHIRSGRSYPPQAEQ